MEEKKFSPGPGLKPRSPALRAGAINTKPPRQSTGPSMNSSLIGSPLLIPHLVLNYSMMFFTWLNIILHIFTSVCFSWSFC